MEDNTSRNTEAFSAPGSVFAAENAVPTDHRIAEHGTPDPVLERAAIVSSVYPSVPERHEAPAPAVGQVATSASLTMPMDDRPIPVVKVLSVRGVEYAMMSILLWIGAGSLIFTLTSLISGSSSFELLTFPIALLLVCVPVFAALFLRLRRAELADPSLRLEASKRRFSQITQILAFLTCFFNIVTVVYLLLSIAGGNEAGNIGKTLGAAAVVLLVAGGILAYYWVDEHRLVGRK